jgi:transaldolase
VLGLFPIIGTGKFQPIYDSTDGKDGHVGLEVSAHLAHDTNAQQSKAHCVLRLPGLGMRIDKVTRQLEDEGVEKFNQP